MVDVGRACAGDRQISDAVVELAIERDLIVDRGPAFRTARGALEAGPGVLLDPPDQVCEAWIGRRVRNDRSRMVRPNARIGDPPTAVGQGPADERPQLVNGGNPNRGRCARGAKVVCPAYPRLARLAYSPAGPPGWAENDPGSAEFGPPIPSC